MLSASQALGRRLRELRLASSKSQAEVATQLGVSRSTIAQLELGNRKLQAEEISQLAQIFGCNPSRLLALPDNIENREDDELLNELLLSVPEFASTPLAFDATRNALSLSRELTLLEKSLGLEGYSAAPPAHSFGTPNTQWEGAHQGYIAAQEERWRMNLGDAPIRDVDETLAMMRVRATKANLPDGVMSLYLQAPETGTLVIVNESLSMEERRFQYVHGYAHALFEHGPRWLVCRAGTQDSLPELRAAAFASRFLLPETGIRRYLHSLGKDTLGRASAAVQKLFSERIGADGKNPVPVIVEGRRRKGATRLSTCDLAQIACYFGVSPSLTAHSLRNLRYMSDDELVALKSKGAKETIAYTKKVLDLRVQQNSSNRDAFQSRLIALSIEALRRGVTTIDQFKNLAERVGVEPEEQQMLLDHVSTS